MDCNSAIIDTDEPLSARIREDIISEALPEGTWLKTHDLAKRYGVSTNPIREALHQLSGEGFIILLRNRGARVRTIDEAFIRNIYDIRSLIEPYLVRLFVEQATEEDISLLKDIQAEIEKTSLTPLELDALDEKFHDVMYNRHFNQEALAIRQRHGQLVRAMARRFPVSPARRATAIDEHRRIIAAIERHDTEAATSIIEHHARGAEQHIIQRMWQRS